MQHWAACWRCRSATGSISPATQANRAATWPTTARCWRRRASPGALCIGSSPDAAPASVSDETRARDWGHAGVAVLYRRHGAVPPDAAPADVANMNRTGLAIVLTVAVVVGVVFGVYPKLDLDIAALAYDPNTKLFDTGLQVWVLRTRDVARWTVALIAVPAFLS